MEVWELGTPSSHSFFIGFSIKIALVDPLMEPLWLGVVEPPLRTCWSARHSCHRNAGHSWNRPRGVRARPPHSLWYHKDNFQDYIKLKDYLQYQYQDNMNINLRYPWYQFYINYNGLAPWFNKRGSTMPSKCDSCYSAAFQDFHGFCGVLFGLNHRYFHLLSHSDGRGTFSHWWLQSQGEGFGYQCFDRSNRAFDCRDHDWQHALTSRQLPWPHSCDLRSPAAVACD